MERKTGFEPVTSSLARRHSTAELLPPLSGAEAQNRTGDTRIFSPLLYRLSYLGTGDIVAASCIGVNTRAKVGELQLADQWLAVATNGLDLE